MNKKILTIVILVILAGAGGFYAGMKYQESKTPQRPTAGNFQNLQNLSPEERQQRLQELGANTGGSRNRTGGQQEGGFASGEIIAKDDKSVTIKLRDGGSKIVFYSDTTEIGKLVNGVATDLEIGKTITVNGSPNQDGSITAQSIQLRSVIAPTP